MSNDSSYETIQMRHFLKILNTVLHNKYDNKYLHVSPILYSKNQVLHKEEKEKIRNACVNYFCIGFPCPVVVSVSSKSSLCLLDFRLTFHMVAYKTD